MLLFSNIFLHGDDKPTLKHKQTPNKKINNLRLTTLESCSHYPDKVIYNFSDYKLTESEKSVLCKGLFLKRKPLNQKFYTPHFLPLIVLISTKQRVIGLKKNWKLYIIYVNRNIWLSKKLTKATRSLSPWKMLTSTKLK